VHGLAPNCERMMTEPLKFILEMQHAALEVGDHRVVGWIMKQRLRDLVLEAVLPAFKIGNMIRFPHIQ
jgi:hypothetical protein